MPYLGNDPGAITDAFTDTFTGDASETNFTLTRASTTNSVFVRIHGVMQRNGTDFTVDGTTLTFTTAPPNASNNIVVQFFTVGAAVVAAKADLGENFLRCIFELLADMVLGHQPSRGRAFGTKGKCFAGNSCREISTALQTATAVGDQVGFKERVFIALGNCLAAGNQSSSLNTGETTKPS